MYGDGFAHPMDMTFIVFFIKSVKAHVHLTTILNKYSLKEEEEEKKIQLLGRNYPRFFYNSVKKYLTYYRQIEVAIISFNY